MPITLHAPSVQKRLLLPLAFSIFILILGFTSSLVYLQKKHFEENTNLVISTAKKGFEHTVNSQIVLLTNLENDLIDSPTLITLLKEKNRDALFEKYKNINKHLYLTHGITHFYFHLPNQKNLLRLHQPSRHSDIIKRYTLLQAQKTKKLSAGIELGPLGTFTLRVVQPIFDTNKELVGYIELGKEVEDILINIRQHHDVELALVIKKTFLDKQLWKNGMQMLNRNANWNKNRDFVVAYSSIPLPGNSLHTLLEQYVQNSTTTVCDIDINGTPWQAIVSPLKDVKEVPVAGLVIFSNESIHLQILKRLVIYASVFTMVVLGLMFLLIRSLLAKTDKFILQQNQESMANATLAKEHANLFLTLLNSTVEAIYGLDMQGRCTFVNKACLDMLGYSHEDELLGKNIYPLIHAQTSAFTRKDVENSLLEQALLINTHVHKTQEKIYKKDGTSFYAQYWSHPIEDEGKIVGSVVTFLKLTDATV